MKSHNNTTPQTSGKEESQSIGNGIAQKKKKNKATTQFADNRPEAIAQRKVQEMANNSTQVKQLKSFSERVNNSPQVRQTVQLQARVNNHSATQEQPVQKQENKTGLSDGLKSGIENLSGYSMDDVRVHYNSDRPAQVQAHAYAKGTDIHLASGQERHLPHEAWHVVQQKQGRVKPTMQLKGPVQVNDDRGLEQEADAMGKRAAEVETPVTQRKVQHEVLNNTGRGKVVQGAFKSEGKSATEVQEWEAKTEAELDEKGEKLLLTFFRILKGRKKAYEWDIDEAYERTIYLLREKLGDYEQAPIPTIMDGNHPIEALTGERSETGYKRLAAWDLKDKRTNPATPDTHTEFSHVTTKADWWEKRLNTVHGADKGELGPGFYTVSGHGDKGTKGIRDEFGKTGKVPRDVLTFRIANHELGKLVNNDQNMAFFLIYVLQHHDGYPAKDDFPNPDGVTNHMTLINTINNIGKALIFPDKDTEVDVVGSPTKLSYEGYREKNGAVGEYSLVVGPQARDDLAGIRQICARGSFGDKIFNEAQRYESRLGDKGT